MIGLSADRGFEDRRALAAASIGPNFSALGDLPF
jgi:hypothetical protein